MFGFGNKRRIEKLETDLSIKHNMIVSLKEELRSAKARNKTLENEVNDARRITIAQNKVITQVKEAAKKYGEQMLSRTSPTIRRASREELMKHISSL